MDERLAESFRREISRLSEDRRLIEGPLDHAVYQVFYTFPEGLPKIHEHDGEPARGYGLFLDGRLALYCSYQSDLGDSWENPSDHDDPDNLREAALRMGLNPFLSAMSSAPVA